MHGRLKAVESLLSGRRAMQKKKTIICTWNYGYGYGICGIYYTVDTVVGFPKTTDVPNPIINQFIDQTGKTLMPNGPITY